MLPHNNQQGESLCSTFPSSSVNSKHGTFSLHKYLVVGGGSCGAEADKIMRGMRRLHYSPEENDDLLHDAENEKTLSAEKSSH